MSKDFTVIPPRTDISPITTIEKGKNHIEIKNMYTQAVIDELVRKANAALDAAVMDRLAKQHGYMKREECTMQPTFIEPVANKGGYWQEYECSECGKYNEVTNYYNQHDRPIFCMFCGAKVIWDD